MSAGIDMAAIRPTGGLIDSTDHLDNRDLLNQRYEEDGYLFFRGVVSPEAAEAARLKMAKVLVDQALIESTSIDAKWIGGDKPSLPEESPLFAGICRALLEDPSVAGQLERLLGEPVSMVPNVLYRAYKPNNKPGPIHQDGVFNPGAEGYKSLWIALCNIDEQMGGMVLAPGYHRSGSLHDKRTSVIPDGIIPENAWCCEPYRQGDVVVIHGFMPHGGMPNCSERIRYSVDTRVQSAANPTVLEGELTKADLSAITLKCDDGGLIELALNDDTLLRFGVNGTPLTCQEFVALEFQGRRIMATRDGEIARMLRHASPG